MTLILLTDGIPPYVMGGMQKHSRLLAEYTALAGVDVILYHCVPPDLNISEESVRESFSEAARPHLTIRTFTYEDRGMMLGHYIRTQKELSRRYLERLKQEEVQPSFVYSKGFVGMEVLRHKDQLPFKCRYGVKFHGMNMFQKQPDFKGELTKYILRRPVKRLMGMADVVFSYGGNITNVIAGTGVPKEKIYELPSGIARDAISTYSLAARKHGKTRFVFVGRYDRVKGMPELYKALERLPEDKWEMAFIGPIPESKRLKLANVNYHGSISDQSTLFGQLDEADVLVCPSISEGMPNVILEGMARGLAIIATDVGATPLLVQANGMLIAESRPDLIQKAMLQMIEMEQVDLTEMRTNSLKHISEHFTWEAIIDQFLKFLNQEDTNG